MICKITASVSILYIFFIQKNVFIYFITAVTKMLLHNGHQQGEMSPIKVTGKNQS